MNTRVALLLLGAVALASANPVLPGRTPQIVEAAPELLVEYVPEAPVVSIINPVHVDELKPEKRPVVGFKEPAQVPEVMIEVLPEEPLPELLIEALPEQVPQIGVLPPVYVPEFLVESLPEEPLPELLIEALPEQVPQIGVVPCSEAPEQVAAQVGVKPGSRPIPVDIIF